MILVWWYYLGTMNQIFIAIIGVVFIGLAFFGVRMPFSNEGDTNAPTMESNGGDTSNKSSNDIVSGGNVLDLSGKGLVAVSQSIFSEKNLEVLNLSDNNLSGALPAEVRHLSNLRELDLSNNNFTGVPAEVGQLSHLEILNLSNNPITGLPYEIGNLKNLKILDLRGTSYSSADLDVIKNGLPSNVKILVD